MGLIYKEIFTVISSLLVLFFIPIPSFGGRAPTWDYCECSWDAWKPWSQCSSDCFGRSLRERSVYMKTHHGCDEFTDCASNDLGYEFKSCNDVCHNSGTKYGTFCSCVLGFKGRCCQTQITCGDPGEITHGYKHGYVYTYGSAVSYSCATHYTLTDGSTSRNCQLNGRWSGARPRCAFSNTCGSNPCKNDGRCQNEIEHYRCICKKGWSGVNCENDVQAPVCTGCHNDTTAYATKAVLYVNWTSPSFSDPHRNAVKLSTNYPQHGYEFPWGDFSVQYVGLKESNGLSTECSFDVSVRPSPCRDLDIPDNGAIICTNWKTDFGRLCRGYCQENFTTPPSVKGDEWFVCGASGIWAPSNTMFDCAYSATTKLGIYSKPQSFVHCNDVEETKIMKNKFIVDLKSSMFKYFCSKFESDCNIENVLVQC